MINCTFENGNQSSLRHVTAAAVVIKNNKILLAKRAEGLLEAGKWCLPGGYMDRDETSKQCAIRETHEETGWEVDDVRLLWVNDNPARPYEDRQNVEFIYLCSATRKTTEADTESDDVRWFDLNELPKQIAFDHHESISIYRQYVSGAIRIPFVWSDKAQQNGVTKA